MTLCRVSYRYRCFGGAYSPRLWRSPVRLPWS